MRTNRLLAGFAVALLFVALTPSPALAITPTSTVLTATPATLSPGNPLMLVAQVSPTPLGGTVTFSEGSTVIGEAEVDPEDGMAALAIALSAVGPHTFSARFGGFGDLDPSVSAAVSVSVVLAHPGGTPTSVTISSGPIAAGGAQVELTATLSPMPDGGRVIFMEGYRILAVNVIDRATGQATALVPLGEGLHSVLAIYEGSDAFASSNSPPLTISVPRDSVVSATGLGVSHATVYPVVDGFVDTTLIRGVALERLSTTIQIFSASTGRRVRSVGLGTREGPYSFAWNGRTLAGSLLPAGRYQVIQTLTDRAGNQSRFTSQVTVSHKRRVSKTGVQTRTGSAYDREGTEGFGLVVPRDSDDSVHVYGNVEPDWAFVSYTFTLPSATRYRTIRFEVVGESQPGRTGALLALLDASGEPAAEATTGTANGRYSVSAGPVVVNSRRVTATVTANGSDRSAFRVVSVRLVYTFEALE